jgi:23S rRNA (guanine745-N1)-methyltransferase
MQLICPLCRALLSRDDRRWCCPDGHSFDIAKEGYLHLHPVQKKKSRTPGDDKQMVAARSRFLNSGHYQRVSDAINLKARQLLSQQSSQSAAIIDAGCGEGYYSTRLQQSLLDYHINSDLVGVDISKPASRAAAKRCRSVQWLVASSSDMPIADHSADIILSLFSPIPAQEFQRCLKADGHLIIASTGPQHLLELRELLYDNVDTSSLNTANALAPQFSPAANGRENIQYGINLQDSSSIQDLLAMTPHYWRAPALKKNQLSNIEELSISIDIQLNCYSITSHSTI